MTNECTKTDITPKTNYVHILWGILRIIGLERDTIRHDIASVYQFVISYSMQDLIGSLWNKVAAIMDVNT